jgi:hypothetical protein
VLSLAATASNVTGSSSGRDSHSKRGKSTGSGPLNFGVVLDEFTSAAPRRGCRLPRPVALRSDLRLVRGHLVLELGGDTSVDPGQELLGPLLLVAVLDVLVPSFALVSSVGVLGNSTYSGKHGAEDVRLPVRVPEYGSVVHAPPVLVVHATRVVDLEEELFVAYLSRLDAVDLYIAA